MHPQITLIWIGDPVWNIFNCKNPAGTSEVVMRNGARIDMDKDKIGPVYDWAGSVAVSGGVKLKFPQSDSSLIGLGQQLHGTTD